ncbi:MAG: Bifunctional NAD(P)H-hydrate repair enzyme Nnr [Spirochaetes bacterium ADurb.Bin110]|nr:MAG: Bifunctional NAD(P)H-hydrate repair enzyme Nnr [Spirochaetes bacterium ADurb.Bin110]
MHALISNRDSLELDALTRTEFNFSVDHLMEIAAIRLWQTLVREVLLKKDKLNLISASSASLKRLSIAAVCGKGDNAGDALAMLRHARLEGYSRLTAYIPEPNTMKPDVILNLRRAERCGAEIVCYEIADLDSIREQLSTNDVILDALLGTGIDGPARGKVSDLVRLLRDMRIVRNEMGNKNPLIVSIDVPSGLSDAWKPEFPIVCADVTLCIEPMKESLYMPSARPYAGDIFPVGGIFPLWTKSSTQNTWLLEESDMKSLLPPISPWAYKMQRGRVAVFAGSSSGAGAALHCIRGAASAGAGYIALFCDEELFSAYLASIGENAIVRVFSKDSFSPECWDVVVAGPGWGINLERERILDMLFQADIPLVLDADGARLFARFASKNQDSSFYRAPIILTPHPGEFSEMLPILKPVPFYALANASETVALVSAFAKKYGITLALRASTTHVGLPDGSCFIYDGSTPGLGIAGSGDVLSGMVGGFLARWLAFLKKTGENRESTDAATPSDSPMTKALLGAILVHGSAGKQLWLKKGWFTPIELANACARISSGVIETNVNDDINSEKGRCLD